MRSFFAISGKIVIVGGRAACLRWAESYVGKHGEKVVLIATARGGERSASVFAEYSNDGLALLKSPKTISTKQLMLYVKRNN